MSESMSSTYFFDTWITPLHEKYKHYLRDGLASDDWLKIDEGTERHRPFFFGLTFTLIQREKISVKTRRYHLKLPVFSRKGNPYR